VDLKIIEHIFKPYLSKHNLTLYDVEIVKEFGYKILRISIDKIGAMQSLLELDLEETKALSDNDWKELCSLTNYEAEDLPLDLLNDLMSIFLEKQAF
jgi:hypothetical protein